MQQRRYSQQQLDAIKARQYRTEQDGVPVWIKPIPETDEPGVLDPRLRADLAPMTTGLKGFFMRVMMKLNARKTPTVQEQAQQMRRMMDGVKSIPITDGVQVKQLEAPDGDRRIPIRIYTPQTPAEGLRPVLYYIHGGGFVCGSMDVVDEMCKLVTEKTGYVVAQVQYRLAPEHPYPAGLNDCYAVLGWISENIASYGGDRDKICISGDSAGGNLALVCALKDRDEGGGRVHLLALLYPTVDGAHMAENMAHNREVYEISEKDKKVLHGFIQMMSGMSGISMADLLGVKDTNDPYFSPYLADLSGLPPVLLIIGEYDFLRTENDRLARKLQDSGVDLRYVRYRGLSHGFADQVGVTPQAEDALEEIGGFMKAHA